MQCYRKCLRMDSRCPYCRGEQVLTPPAAPRKRRHVESDEEYIPTVTVRRRLHFGGRSTRRTVFVSDGESESTHVGDEAVEALEQGEAARMAYDEEVEYRFESGSSSSGLVALNAAIAAADAAMEAYNAYMESVEEVSTDDEVQVVFPITPVRVVIDLTNE